MSPHHHVSLLELFVVGLDRVGPSTLHAALRRLHGDDTTVPILWAGQVEIQERAVAAWSAFGEGRQGVAIGLMRQAADLEDRSGRHVAMENRLSPMRELLGELLIEANEPAQALKELEASLRNNPNRYRSFAGAAKAAERTGNRTQAKVYYVKLISLAESADTERPDLVIARQFLARN